MEWSDFKTWMGIWDFVVVYGFPIEVGRQVELL